MYADRWSRRLRQGDIVGPFPLPLMGKDVSLGFKSSTLIAPTPGDAPLTVTMPAANVHVAIISHDCEFNEDKRNKMLVARLQGPQGNLTEEQWEALRASNDVLARSEAGLPVAGVDSFLVDPVPGLFDTEQVVSFSTITPLPMKMAGDLYKLKCAEMTHETRVRFREKLAWFVGRDGDDIPDDEKSDKPEQSTAGAE